MESYNYDFDIDFNLRIPLFLDKKSRYCSLFYKPRFMPFEIIKMGASMHRLQKSPRHGSEYNKRTFLSRPSSLRNGML